MLPDQLLIGPMVILNTVEPRHRCQMQQKMIDMDVGILVAIMGPF